MENYSKQPSNPSADSTTYTSSDPDLMEKLRVNKQSAFLYRRRRQPDWTDNYTLYRDKVQLNRLTQRQSVNIPLLKSSIKTLLKDIDNPPILYFVNLDNNDQAEVYYNEYWHQSSIDNDTVLKDIVDKRQVMLFGRSFKFLNIIDGKFKYEIVAPDDVLIDRYVDPTDIDSARFLIREHIYVPLASLKLNPKYNQKAVRNLEKYLGTNAGLIKADQNQLDWVEKQRKMASMGVIDVWNPILGETYVELNDWYIFEPNEKTGRDEIRYLVTCEDMDVLYNAPLEECIGKTKDNFWSNHYPATTWGDETERTDFWSDGVADALRTLNKVMNAWFSQLIENRTYRNFNMNYYNSSLGDEGFVPQTFEPVPWGWYPIPVGAGGKLGDAFTSVPVPDLSDTLKDMEFIMTIAQQASAATTTQEGTPQPNQVTLGEVQLMLQNSQERVKSMAVYYTASWEDFGLKFSKMLEAAPDLIDPMTISKKGRLTNKQYSKTISPSDYTTPLGFKVEVKMKEDQMASDQDSLQKLQYANSLMPMNKALKSITEKKALEFADLSASEIEEVTKEQELVEQQLAMNPMAAGGQPGQPGAQPMQAGQAAMIPQQGQPAQIATA